MWLDGMFVKWFGCKLIEKWMIKELKTDKNTWIIFFRYFYFLAVDGLTMFTKSTVIFRPRAFYIYFTKDWQLSVCLIELILLN